MADYPGTPDDDFYNGTPDGDTMNGAAGDDVLNGRGGDDVISGGDGDDYMRGNAGKDRYDGGDGFDRISFYDLAATQGVIADLRTGVITNDGFGNKERMVSVEALGGTTVFADQLYGNAVDNLLFIDRGDVAKGFDGDDSIQIGSIEGATLDSGAGAHDSILFALQTDRLAEDGSVESVFADHGVTVDLAKGRIIDDGFGFGARIRGVEDVYGSRLNDTLKGDALDNVLIGYDGDDALLGGAGADQLVGDAGDDTLSGGLGDDILIAGGGLDRLTGGDGADIFSFAVGRDGATRAAAPRILDFDQNDAGAGEQVGDRIGLSYAVDFANPGDGFTFIGTAAFSGTAGEVRYAISGGSTYVYVDGDGGGSADLVIRLNGAITLDAGDFLF